MADQTKDPQNGKKPVNREKPPAPPLMKGKPRQPPSGTFPVATGSFPVAETTPGQAAPGQAGQGQVAPGHAAPGQAMPPPPEGTAAPAATGATPSQPPANKAAAPKPEKRKPKADSEQARLKKEEQARRSRRRNRQMIGIAVAILVVVGAVSIVMSSVQMFQNFFDDSGEIDEYQNRFKAFVWFDMLPFDSVSMVDENSIKQVIIWSIFDDQGDGLERNELGEALIPASEVDRYAAEIFGPDFRFSGHSGFEDQVYQLKYFYDSDTQMYAVPTTSLSPSYLPTVVEVIREPGGVRRVVMGYVSAINSENQVVATPDFDHPVRYMDFMLRRDGGGYYLYSIQNNTTHTVAAASGSTSAAPAESLPALGLEDPALPDGPAITSEPVEEEISSALDEPEESASADEDTSEDSSAA